MSSWWRFQFTKRSKSSLLGEGDSSVDHHEGDEVANEATRNWKERLSRVTPQDLRFTSVEDVRVLSTSNEQHSTQLQVPPDAKMQCQYHPDVVKQAVQFLLEKNRFQDVLSECPPETFRYAHKVATSIITAPATSTETGLSPLTQSQKQRPVEDLTHTDAVRGFISRMLFSSPIVRYSVLPHVSEELLRAHPLPTYSPIGSLWHE